MVGSGFQARRTDAQTPSAARSGIVSIASAVASSAMIRQGDHIAVAAPIVWVHTGSFRHPPAIQAAHTAGGRFRTGSIVTGG